MARRRRSLPALLVVLLIGALAVGGLYAVPGAVSKGTYAVETGRSLVAQERLATANDLTSAFKNVATALRPSAVSVSSVRKMLVAGSQGGQHLTPQIPEEFRRVFGDDLFERFHFDIPSPRSLNLSRTANNMGGVASTLPTRWSLP